jgi:hypothetical protein
MAFNVNSGDNAAPKLCIFGSRWGLLELPRLPHEAQWSFEFILDRLLQQGFDGIQANSADRRAIVSRGLLYCTQGRVNETADVEPVLKTAADEGALCITLHVGWSIESDSQIDALLCSIFEWSAKLRIPAYVETHRQTVAQDLWRIHRMIERNPAVRFNGDFSHLYCGNEMNYGGRFHLNRNLLEPVLQRTCFIHGRVSDGQSMQIDISDPNPGSNLHVANFMWMWTRAMTHWIKAAGPGDLFIFAPELGPPSSFYSTVYTDSTGRMCELCDRWEQTLLLKRLAQRAFAAARDQQNVH